MLRNVVFTIMSALLVTTLVYTPSSFSAGIRISLIPSKTMVQRGETLTVDVTVSDVVDLCTWQIALKYNETALNCTAIWIPDDNVFAGYVTVPVSPVFGVDTVDGAAWVLFGNTLLGNEAVDAAVGTLCRANFTVRSVGIWPITIATTDNPAHFSPLPWDTWHSDLLDINQQEIPFVEESCIVTTVDKMLTITTTEGGTTDPPPGLHLYEENATVTITAMPTLGYDFNGWELDDEDAGSDNPCLLLMSKSFTLHAIFVLHTPVTWIVDDDGPADFHTITEATNSPEVAYGDVIYVRSGVYCEHVGLSGLKLIGENPETTIIDGNGSLTTVSLGSHATISNFTVQNGDYGIEIRSIVPTFSHDKVEGNRIVDNRCGAIRLMDCAGNTISDNFIENNTLFGIHLAGNLGGAKNNSIINNTVVSNGHGIDLYGGSYNNTFRNNNMSNNTYNFGIILRGETQAILFHRNYVINDVDTSNTVNGKPVCFWVNQNNAQVPPDAGYVALIDCTNITIDSCTLTNNLQGILLLGTDNTSILDNCIADNVYGAFIQDSSNNTLTRNTFADNLYGVSLAPLSRYTTMRNNSINNGQVGFGLSVFAPLTLDASDLVNNIDTSNTIDGKPVIYWLDQHDRQVPTNAGCVVVINSTGIVIRNLNLTGNVQSIFLVASNDTLVADNFVTNSVCGIDVANYWSCSFFPQLSNEYHPSFNITVVGNTLVNNDIGMRIKSDNCTIFGNRLWRNPLGICLAGASNCLVTNNTVTESNADTWPYYDHDLYIFHYPESPWEHSREMNELEIGGIIIGGSHNAIHGNTVALSWIGISMIDWARGYLGHGNIVFHNNLFNNCYQAFESQSRPNSWDNGYPSGGNYWSDYSGTDSYLGSDQNETGSDGIGDTSFRSQPVGQWQVVDHFPLMKPYTLKIGDINDDRTVNMQDLGMAARAFGCTPNDPRWNPAADLDNNKTIDLRDIALVAKDFGKHD